MDLIHAIVYGIVQGLTAFLPISSDAHIRLVSAFSGWPDPGAAFTAVIQLGPTLAVIIFFRKELAKAISAFFGKDKSTPDSKLAWGVFWGTIPIVILGFALQRMIETSFRSLAIIAVSFIVIGVVMYFADNKAREKRTVADVEVRDGIIVGLWQCLALIPGTSRSGSTIAGSLFQGFTREAAARFSFLLSVPSFTLAGLYEAFKYRKDLGGALLTPLAVSLVVSFVVGYACITWFLHYLQKRGIAPFVLYRVVLGIVLLVMLKTGKLAEDAGIEGRAAPSANATTSSP